MTVEAILGNYVIEGCNQDEAKTRYQGTLDLSQNEYGQIIATWNLGSSQIQEGTGFFKDNLLVLNFHYLNDDQELFKGTVVYKCLIPDLLEGFWTEEHGDPRYVGTERAYRTQTSVVVH